MKSILTILIILVSKENLFAQQWVEFSQKNHYKLFLNPANSGSDSKLYSTIAHRSQYTFLSNTALASQFIEFSMPIIKKEIGMGIRIVNDFIGYQRYTLAEFSGAYHLYTKSGNFSFGIGIGAVNLNINGSELRASGGNYEGELIIHNDEHIPNENSNGLSPVFSAGVRYKLNQFEFGIAMQNINSPTIKLTEKNSETNIVIDRTINVHTSYVIKTKKINIIPLVHYNTDIIKHQLQFGAYAEINNIYFGLAFRGYTGYNNDAIIGEFGIKIIDKIKIGYSYDYNVSGINKSSLGSHELSIRYFFPQKFLTKSRGNIIFNPRFL